MNPIELISLVVLCGAAGAIIGAIVDSYVLRRRLRRRREAMILRLVRRRGALWGHAPQKREIRNLGCEFS